MLKAEGVPLLIHQPSYSMLNRWIEDELLDTLDELGVGCIAFSPLAQGMLSSQISGRRPRGCPRQQGRLARPAAAHARRISRASARSNAIAQGRGQTLAQMAIAWALRDPRVTSALIGARTVAQLEDSLAAVKRLDFSRRGAGRDRPPRHRRRRRFVAGVVEARQRGRQLSERRALIETLGLAPHPEGGWYRETWRADAAEGERAAATAILFLLEEGQSSHWHKVDATELWLFHAGSPLRLLTAPGDDGPVRDVRLGADIPAGEQPQRRIAPANGRRRRPTAAGPWSRASSRPASSSRASRWRRRAGRRGRFDSSPSLCFRPCP